MVQRQDSAQVRRPARGARLLRAGGGLMGAALVAGLVLGTVAWVKAAITSEVLVIDDFANGENNWSSFQDTGTTFNVSTNSANSGYQSTYGMRIDYDFSQGAWGVVENDIASVFSQIDLQGRGTSLRFYYRGVATAPDPIELELQGAGDSVPYRIQVGQVPQSDWVVREYVISGYQDTAIAARDKELPNLANLSSLGLRWDRVGQNDSGTLYLDRIETFGAHTWVIYDPDISDHTPSGDAPFAYGSPAPAVNTTTADATHGFVTQITFDHNAVGAAGVTMYLPSAYANTPNGNAYSLNAYTYLHCYVKKNVISAPPLYIKLYPGRGNIESDAYKYELKEIAASTEWQEVKIPLRSYDGAKINLGSVREVDNRPEIAIKLETRPSNDFTLSLDGLEFVTDPEEFGVIEDFESPVTYWGWNASHGSALTSSQGYNSAQSLRVDYSFNSTTDPYRTVARQSGMNLVDKGRNAVVFMLRGSGGNHNLDLKFVDANGTNFRALLNNFTDTQNAWREVVIPFDRFEYFLGDKQFLRWNAVQKLQFGISASSATDYTGGSIYLDDIRLVRIPDYSDTPGKPELISSFAIDNNPFSPGKSTRGASATFSFTLHQTASVQLSVFDLRGREIYRSPSAQYPQGLQSLTWDGQDKSGHIVNNGLYVYNFKVKGSATGDTANIKQVIGVVR